MNFSDSEIVSAIIKEQNFETTVELSQADVIFVNTCSIRDNAEQRVRKRLTEFRALKKKKPGLIIGILGCMAERLKDQLLEEEKMVNMIVGPDAYRDLPRLIQTAEEGQKAINVLLSMEETYADINPVRLTGNGVSAFISIMRGCENFCSYCVVPYTRGKERSRNPKTILDEAAGLFERGYREITLLGQNVNSFAWKDDGINFAKLLNSVASIDPLLRVRFATSHPKDLSDELLNVMASKENICKSIHLPVQSGSTRMLKLMHRNYTRDGYMERIEAIRRIIPECAISTDVIAGYSSETDEDHQFTLSLMEWAAFDYAFMFKYSERPNTLAAKKHPDDVPETVKSLRLREIIDLQQELSLRSNLRDIGKTFEVLAESVSKRSKAQFSGRNSQNKMVVFPRLDYQAGDYVQLKIQDCTAATLKA